MFCVFVRGDSDKYTKRMIYQNLFKVSVIYDLDGTISSFFNNSKIFDNRQCRYNEGPLYMDKSQNGRYLHGFLRPMSFAFFDMPSFHKAKEPMKISFYILSCNYFHYLINNQ